MPNLSVKAENVREEVNFNIYSLAFKDYHQKVAEIEGKGSVELEPGSYKVEALDDGRSYQKVVLVRGDLSTVIDFADRYEEVKDPYAGLKGAMIGAGAVIIIGVLIYFSGLVDVLAEMFV